MRISADLMAMLEAALTAGAAIRAIQDAGVIARTKSDGTPVCAADRIAETIILDQLRTRWPDAGFIGEESAAAGGNRELRQRTVFVDALDGTKEFLAGRSDYTVNIGFIENGAPRLGVVHCPADGQTFAGAVGTGASDNLAIGLGASGIDPRDHEEISRRATPLMPRQRPEDRNAWRAVVSRSHPDDETTAFLARNGISQTVPIGSSLKFCLLADGRADIYPRLGPINAWDIAAGHAVLAAAGGRVLTTDGKPLLYSSGTGGCSVSGFVAWADASAALAASAAAI